MKPEYFLMIILVAAVVGILLTYVGSWRDKAKTAK